MVRVPSYVHSKHPKDLLNTSSKLILAKKKLDDQNRAILQNFPIFRFLALISAVNGRFWRSNPNFEPNQSPRIRGRVWIGVHSELPKGLNLLKRGILMLQIVS